jgi:hypothetical protein
MIKPKEIDILGVKHKVKHLKLKKHDGYYYSNNIIEINKDINVEEDYLKVLLHECLHGVVLKSGLHQDVSLPQEHCFIDSTITFLFRNFDIKLK